ncbi:hypothetical protein BKI52_04680 [marine bacterium AO1-C]|nr:hypothetical protein BKI52_04680 [marine bacterium AO1-C]
MKIRIYKFIFLVSIFLGIVNKGFSQTKITVTPNSPLLKIGKQVQFFEDQNNRLTIQDILKPEVQEQFQAHAKDVFNCPPANTTIWFKFIVQNQSEEDIFMAIGESFSTWYADLYKPNANNQYTQAKEYGSMRPLSNNDLNSNFHCALIAKGSEKNTQVIYLKIFGSSPKNHVFQIGTFRALDKYLQVNDYIVTLFIGVILALLIYNLFIYYSARDIIYLVYILYLGWVLFVATFTSGYALAYKHWLWDYFYSWNGSGYFLITLFASIYLNLKKVTPRFYRWIWFCTILLSAVFPLFNLTGLISVVQMAMPYQLVLTVYYLSLLFIGIWLVVKGHRNARFYTIAWSFVIIGTILFVLTLNAILPYNRFTYNIQYLGFSLEALFFALALGDRMNTLKEEKEAAQAQNLLLIKEQNINLEKKVQERTQELMASKDEIMTQNEELRQVQEELETQRDFLDKQNVRLNRQNDLITTSIRAAESIQKTILPTKPQLEDLLKDYFLIYKPRDVVSGDFYSIHQTPNKTFLLVADCTGHGVPGAFMTLIGYNLIDQIIKFQGITQPNQILTRLHEEVHHFLRQESYNESSGMDAALLTMEPTENAHIKITFSGAKNGFYYYNAATGEFNQVKGTRKSIGGFQSREVSFEHVTVELPPNSLIYTGTDGFQDQHNVQRKKFGRKRLEELIESLTHLPLQEQRKQLVQQLRTHMEGTDQRDDILWMGFKI